MPIWSRKTADLPLAGIKPEGLARLFGVWQEVASKDSGRPAALPVELLSGILPNLLLFDIDPDPLTARYRLVGPALKQLLGRDPTGLTVDEAYPPDIADEVMTAVRRVVTKQGPVCTRNEYKILVRLFGYTRLMLPLYGPAGEVRRIVAGIYPLGSALRSAREWQQALAAAEEERWGDELGNGRDRGGDSSAEVWLL